ncbi:hypothetical protein [Siphonobacter aquaeclarae]|uniref:Uncharacterized protein n=1 Tax=Siphonobacter aquaeclarae TaxID=563176 RepID=A0A1G9T833_9BACT|nr:hypothetical protein [Siphonobacter aquaeclarae]SDM43841.1 hypothetical protein SAMN04488090_3452 [Siphonobacter aquaeclarae]
MDRSGFVKSILALTGTAFVYGCKDVVDELTDTYSSPTSKEAQNWFSNQYLKTVGGGRTAGVSVARELDWSKQQIAKSAKHDFIWVPVAYKGDEKGCAMLMWREGEEHVQQLAQYLSWTVREGFLVYRKPTGEYDGFLAQLAYDPQNSSTDPARFTGLVVNADWNENILRSWRFLDGKLVNYYNPEIKTKAGRTQGCTVYYTQYATVTGTPTAGGTAVTYTLTTVPHVTCYDDPFTGSDQGGYTGSGGYSPSNTGGYSPPPPPVYINWKSTDLTKYVREIENRLVTPCFNAVADKLFSLASTDSQKLGAYVGYMLNTLMSPSTNVKIELSEENLGSTTDGVFRVDRNVPYQAQLVLNTQVLQSASKEYIAATLIHELVHGLYNEQGSTLKVDQQHAEMAQKYIEPMTDALVGLYGMDKFHAKALACGGLPGAYDALGLSLEDQTRMNQLAKGYRNGTFGQKCQ